MLDIAERGRSLGVILIGAQQTASEIERRVTANASFRVVGRLDTAEAARDEYGFLTDAARARASILKPGTMFLHQPEMPVPLLVQFPFPAWATRKDEVGHRRDRRRPGSAHRPLTPPCASCTQATGTWAARSAASVAAGRVRGSAGRGRRHRARESVDIVLVAGDIFDSFSPPRTRERLLYEKLEELVRSGIQVVLLAGNHDHAGHMEALRGLAAPCRRAQLRRGLDGAGESAAPAAFARRERGGADRGAALGAGAVRTGLRVAVGEPAAPVQQYAGPDGGADRATCGASPPRRQSNLFSGHMLIDGAEIGPGGGERQIQIGQNFAVQAAALPTDAQYVALGHVHKPPAHAGGGSDPLRRLLAAARLRRIAAGVFGEGGRPQAGAAGGSARRWMCPAAGSFAMYAGARQDLSLHAEQYGDDLPQGNGRAGHAGTVAVPAGEGLLAERGRGDREAAATCRGATKPEERRGLQPDELFARYYGERKGAEISAEMREAFSALLREASEVAAS